MTLAELEARVAERPHSPLFARLAASYLEAGNAEKALDLCIEGLKLYPNYATARLLLGKCYEALGRTVEALLEYRRVLKVVPDNATVRELVRRMESNEQQAFKAFAEERERRLAGRKGSVRLEDFAKEVSPEKESTVEFLLRRLQEARKAPPTETQTAPPPVVENKGNKIVTATLAEIYASQGEYREAIETYRTLLALRPVDANRFQKRIMELETLEKLHQTDVKP
jgi:tetratricopeptide (TPR) repeat protein